jgi:hypothetical protein
MRENNAQRETLVLEEASRLGVELMKQKFSTVSYELIAFLNIFLLILY